MAPLDRTGGRGAGRSGRGRSFRGGGGCLDPTRTGQPRQGTEAGSPGWYEARLAGRLADVILLERILREAKQPRLSAIRSCVDRLHADQARLLLAVPQALDQYVLAKLGSVAARAAA